MADMSEKPISLLFLGVLLFYSKATRAVDVALCTQPSFVDCTTYDMSSSVCSKRHVYNLNQDDGLDTSTDRTSAADLADTVYIGSVAVPLENSCTLFPYVFLAQISILVASVLFLSLHSHCKTDKRTLQKQDLQWDSN